MKSAATVFGAVVFLAAGAVGVLMVLTALSFQLVIGAMLALVGFSMAHAYTSDLASVHARPMHVSAGAAGKSSKTGG